MRNHKSTNNQFGFLQVVPLTLSPVMGSRLDHDIYCIQHGTYGVTGVT